jgi:aspartokinase/homoserine dehydrogenase 1
MKIIKFQESILQDSEYINVIFNIISKISQNNRYLIILPLNTYISNKLLNIISHKIYDGKYIKTLKKLESLYINVIKNNLSIYNQIHAIIYLKKLIINIEKICESIIYLKEISQNTIKKILSIGERISNYIIKSKLKELSIQLQYIDLNKLIKQYYSNSIIITTDIIKEVFKTIHLENKYNIVIHGLTYCITNKNVQNAINTINNNVLSLMIDNNIISKIEIWTKLDNNYNYSTKNILNNIFISYEQFAQLTNVGYYDFINNDIITKSIKKQIELYIIDYNTDKLFIINDESSKKTIQPSSYEMKNISILLISFQLLHDISDYYKYLTNLLYKYNIKIILHTICYLNNLLKVIINKTPSKIIYNKIKNKLYIKNDNIKTHDINMISDLSIIFNLNKDHTTNSNINILSNKNIIDTYSISKNIHTIIKKDNSNKELNSHLNKKHKSKIINIFIIGIGQVGSHLIDKIKNQINYIKHKFNIELIINGIANSKKMMFNNKGIDFKNWKQKFINSNTPMNIIKFIQQINLITSKNKIIVDNTDSKEIAMMYNVFLKNYIHIVTSNKIACSSNLKYYNKIKNLSQKFNTSLLFETNVGAGLPVISTLNDLINTGDKIHKIEAVLSGSLNFIFNNFNETTTFKNVVLNAQKAGYTEPDPRVDLNGVDVKRKILILARECGSKIELKDILYENFLPNECLNTHSINEFYKKLEKNEIYFQNILKKSIANNTKLRFIAEYNNNITKIVLTEISKNHPFYNLQGQDNMFLYYTKYYNQQPLIIKGAGAGAEVTALGVFSDIIKIATKY